MCDSAPKSVTITGVAPPVPPISPYVLAGAVIGALLLVGFLAFHKK